MAFYYLRPADVTNETSLSVFRHCFAATKVFCTVARIRALPFRAERFAREILPWKTNGILALIQIDK